jgi:hypothetical protein
MTYAEADNIVEIHDTYGISALWADYPESTLEQLRELYEQAWDILDGV